MKFLDNKEIDLPKLTFELMEKLENIKENKFKMKRINLIKSKYNFLCKYLTDAEVHRLLDGNSLEDINIKNLELLFFSIENELDKPLIEAQIKEQTQQFEMLLNNKNIKEVLNIYNNQNKKKRK